MIRRERNCEYGLASRVSDVLFLHLTASLMLLNWREWILQDRLPVRFQLQLQKLLWADAAGH